MPIEHEQRFALDTRAFIRDALTMSNGRRTCIDISQWYLTPVGTKPTVRVRRSIDENNKVDWCLTIKGPRKGSLNAKAETELALTESQAEELIAQAVYPELEKTRYLVPITLHGLELKLEVDVYANRALRKYDCVELELPNEAEAVAAFVDVVGDVDEFDFRLLLAKFEQVKPSWVGGDVTSKWPSNRKLARELHITARGSSADILELGAEDDEDEDEPRRGSSRDKRAR